MAFLKNIFGKKEQPVKTPKEFWDWFQRHQADFFKAVKEGKNIEHAFFSLLAPKLAELQEGFYFLSGMADDHTAELILTPDGAIANIVFVEELVQQAPSLSNWKFTALKPAMDIRNVRINMSGYNFDSDNLSFYSIEHSNYPDEIDIVLVHDDYNEENKTTMGNGSYLFLDNYLGELNAVTLIDNLTVTGKSQAEKELIPIDKLKDFLNWREKEFIEKYHGIRYDTENDEYSMMEAELKSGNKLLAVINTELLSWDRKASHPWVCILSLEYDGIENNGMPDEKDYELLNSIEEELMQQLIDKDGYLNIGRQTAEGKRQIYFACNDFRKPSKEFRKISEAYSGNFTISYDIYKDKYWQSFERFN